MQEYVTQAFVLDAQPAGEYDLRIQLFTQRLGRVIVFARAARKAHSKLAAHLQPLSIVTVRLVERRGMQVVDALAIEKYVGTDMRATQALVEVAGLISAMTDLYHPDDEVWNLIETRRLASAATLRVLGFDPAHARCGECEKERPEHFIIRTTSYLCANCKQRSMAARNRAVGSAVVVS